MWKLILFIIGYIVIFGTQFLYQDPLFEYSDTFIPYLQSSFLGKFWDIWYIYSFFGGGKIQGLVMAYLAIFESQTSEALILVINFTIPTFLVVFLKMLHHSPRPFWVFNDIETVTCYT